MQARCRFGSNNETVSGFGAGFAPADKAQAERARERTHVRDRVNEDCNAAQVVRRQAKPGL